MIPVPDIRWKLEYAGKQHMKGIDTESYKIFRKLTKKTDPIFPDNDYMKALQNEYEHNFHQRVMIKGFNSLCK